MGTTRVPLETVIPAFDLGALPEEIVYRYDQLQPTDIYAVPTVALQHPDEVDAYLRRIDPEAQTLRGEIKAVTASRICVSSSSPVVPTRIIHLSML